MAKKAKATGDTLPSYGGRLGARLAAICAKHGAKFGDETFDALAMLQAEGNEELKELYEANPERWQLGTASAGTSKSKTEDMGY